MYAIQTSTSLVVKIFKRVQVQVLEAQALHSADQQNLVIVSSTVQLQ
jgi:hypothetical protein